MKLHEKKKNQHFQTVLNFKLLLRQLYNFKIMWIPCFIVLIQKLID